MLKLKFFSKNKFFSLYFQNFEKYISNYIIIIYSSNAFVLLEDINKNEYILILNLN